MARDNAKGLRSDSERSNRDRIGETVKRILILVVGVLMLTACDRPGAYFDVESGKFQDVQIYAEWEMSMPYQREIDPPTRVDVIMFPDEMHIYSRTAKERCDDWGGELIFYPKTYQFVCEGVDY